MAGLPLTLLAILLEIFYINIAKRQEISEKNYLRSSIFWGIIYILIAVYSIVQFPFVENPAYSSIFTILLGVVS